MTTGAGTTSAPEEPHHGGRSQRAAAAWSERLYAAHYRMVFGLCRALLRNTPEAEDAAQQVFLSAHRSLLNGAEPREPAAWLATIARNECWARIRGRMREPLAVDAADAVGGVDPVYEAIRRADLAALWRAIRSLPRQQRDALLLREFGGLRYDELAAALAVTEPAVESLLFRARARLRVQLQPLRAAFVPFARWLVGGGAPAVAAKAVAVGLVTGTAVVAPEVVERHHAPPPAPHQRAPAVHARTQASPPGGALQQVRVSSPTRVVRHESSEHHGGVTHEVEAVRTTERRHGGENASHDGQTTQLATTTQHDGGGGGDDHGGQATTVATTTVVEAAAVPTTTSGDGGHDGGGSGPSDGPGGSDGSGGSDG